MRLDLYLFQRGLASSRNEAKTLITSGAVTVGGKLVTKPAFSMDEAALASVAVDRSIVRFVSRGGFKLDAALREFNINPQGRLCIDIGASTGGFTDCLLQNGAEGVIALDSGTLQLSSILREDNRVFSLENYNARYMSSSDFPYVPSLAVMDVSFISATYIIEPLYNVLSEKSDFICLVKPQFEVGRENIGKGGIVKSEQARSMALTKVVDYAKSIGFSFCGSIVSPIEGGDGNIEYLAHFRKESDK